MKTQIKRGRRTATPPKLEILSLFKDKENKTDLLVFLALNIVLYAIIKWAYPYMFCHPDSGAYISSAVTNEIIGYRPSGYAWFLQWAHAIRPGFSTLFTCQFLLNFIAQLVLLFTVKSFFKLNRVTSYLLGGFLFIAPALLLSINYIMSDSLFHALTIIYLTTLLWILKKPHLLTWVVHFAVMYYAIEVRYSALIYPVLSAITIFYYYRKRGLYKLIAVLPVILLLSIYTATKKQNLKEFGVDKFSPFSGWTLANNVSSILPYIDLQPKDIEDEEIQLIHAFFRNYPDSIYSKENVKATVFMWLNDKALKQYLYYTLEQRNVSYIEGWMRAGEEFSRYGKYMIKKYPWLYTKHYLFQNFLNAFGTYRLKQPIEAEYDEITRTYYNLDVEKYTFKHNIFLSINGVRNIIQPILLTIFLLSVVVFFVKRKLFGFTPLQLSLLYCLLLFLVCYVGFGFLSHPINNFRYLMPIYFVKVFFPVVIIAKLIERRKKEETETA